jgi:glycosyltransferase involved in cell wall biosynthesis
MKRKIKIAYISSFSPRVCGIASFTRDLILASSETPEIKESKVIALNKGEHTNYGPEVVYSFDDNKQEEYLKAAEYLNQSDFDIVSLQHEYGLYGGDKGEDIVNLVKALKKPLVTTFHMISPIEEATTSQIEITKALVNYSRYVVVMTKIAAEILKTSYQVEKEKIKVIPHGAPDINRGDANSAKIRLGIKNNRIVLMSINIIRASQGIDLVIKALPEIIKVFPNLTYLVVGRDPQDVKQPYPYREEITQLVTNLDLWDTVKFENRYVPMEELIDFIKAADIFITPYRPPEQSSSGSLAYAVAAGKVCISTPYNYACELLGNGRGVIVPWLDSKSIAKEILALLGDQKRMKKIANKAYQYGRNMVWSDIAKKYVDLFNKVIKSHY